MHEFIKYSVKLEDGVIPYDATENQALQKESDDLDNIDTDGMSDEEIAQIDERANELTVLIRKQKCNWQAIFADYKYGTHYMIYAKFMGTPNDSNGSFTLKSVQLYLQNYTGAITLGLAGSPKMIKVKTPELEVKASEKDSPSKYKLFIPLQALNVTDVEDVFTINGDQGITIHAGDLLETVPVFRTIGASSGESGSNPNKRKIPAFVDELFNTRLGEDVGPTNIGARRLVKLSEFESMETNIDEEVLEAEGSFDIEESGFISGVGSGLTIPCKPTNTIFHI